MLTHAPIERFSGQHSFLSNFWGVAITAGGMTFPSVECAYQAAKCALDAPDRRSRQFSFTTMPPGKAKLFGKRLPLRSDWETVKVAIMTRLIAAKFCRGTGLAERLMATDPRELIEGNTWGDTFWGVCNGRGRNQLGETLMMRRHHLLA